MAGRVKWEACGVNRATRGPNRGQAVSLSKENVVIITVDHASRIGSVPCNLDTADDLTGMAKEVEALEACNGDATPASLTGHVAEFSSVGRRKPM